MELHYEKNGLISEKQFNNHLELYEGYIDDINDVNQKKQQNKIDDIVAAHQKLQYALDGVILHELYFKNIKTQKNASIKNQDMTEIFENDNEYEQWRNEFTSLALTTRGWVIYAYDPRTDNFLNFSLKSHDEGLVCGMIPIIILDMYEHAYYTDYGNNIKGYIHNFIQNLDWQVVKDRLNQI